MSGEFKSLIFESGNKIAKITINRPQKLNTITIETLAELRRAVEAVLAREDIRVAIITGVGEKAFVAGADISELASLGPIQAKSFALTGQALFDLIENGGKPFIAAINGFALGGGCELSLACALRIASEDARLGQPEIKLGIITGFGGSQRLVRIVGKARAIELCLIGEPIDAQTAFQWGLVHRVVPSSGLLEEAMSVAEKLASYSPIALRLTLEAVHKASEFSFPQGLSHEAGLFALCFATEDMKEGTRAFLEKRKANFRGK